MSDQERPGFGDDDMVREPKRVAIVGATSRTGIAPSSEIFLSAQRGALSVEMPSSASQGAGALTPYSPTWEDVFLPFWAERKAHGELERGAQLCTRDGRRIGNAWVMGSRKMEEPARTVYMIYTDIGTQLLLSAEEVDGLFYPPSWIGNQEALNEVRQAAARKSRS